MFYWGTHYYSSTLCKGKNYFYKVYQFFENHLKREEHQWKLNEFELPRGAHFLWHCSHLKYLMLKNNFTEVAFSGWLYDFLYIFYNVSAHSGCTLNIVIWFYQCSTAIPRSIFLLFPQTILSSQRNLLFWRNNLRILNTGLD